MCPAPRTLHEMCYPMFLITFQILSKIIPIPTLYYICTLYNVYFNTITRLIIKVFKLFKHMAAFYIKRITCYSNLDLLYDETTPLLITRRIISLIFFNQEKCLRNLSFRRCHSYNHGFQVSDNEGCLVNSLDFYSDHCF